MSKFRYLIDPDVAPREGGFAAVYRSVREHDGEVRALKLLRNDQDPEHLARFQDEARIQGQLHHPYIVGVDDSHFVPGQTFLAMEFVDGGTLRDLMNAGMNDESKIFAISYIADAVAYAHEFGVIHRDLKPENVLYDRVRRIVKVSDFGVARQGGFSLGLTRGFIGTPDYAAPEQKASGHADERSDIFSLGVMVHEMFFGEMPRFNEDGCLLKWETFDKTPDGFRDIVISMLAHNPDHRYQSIRDFQIDFQTCVERSEICSVLAPSKLEKVVKVVGFGLLIAALAAGVIALARKK